MKAGLAISPQTPSASITDAAFAQADMILVMTVHPGKGGQKFMPECLQKVEELRERFGWDKDIEVDGGIGPGNICQCAKAGELVPASRCEARGEADQSVRIKRYRGRNVRLFGAVAGGRDRAVAQGC